jgi:glycosyltransferase involved in cell wall biosynthesis
MTTSAATDGLVSVIIPTYHRNDLLREAIGSVRRQDYGRVETIVVDDSGEEAASAVAEEHPEITYIPLTENRGENPARTIGVEASAGQYVQFLDDDDLLRADKLTKQVPLIDESTGVVYSGLRYHGTDTTVEPNPEVRGDVLKYALQFRLWPPCFTSSLLIDRPVLKQVMPLRFHGAGDTTFMIDLAERTEFEFHPDPLVAKRLTDALGGSWANIANKRELLNIHAAKYDRFGPEVRSAALADIYRKKGLRHVDEAHWSLPAIVAFARAAYHTPDDRLVQGSTFLASLLGRPGLAVRERAIGATWRDQS